MAGVAQSGGGAAASAEPRPAKPILAAKGIAKSYGPVVALNSVDLELYPGEVLGLIGDNGAGKSTLVKCIAGAEQPDSGEILLDGRRVALRNPLDAHQAGIETVHQSLGVVPALDIASNLFLGRELRLPGALGTLLRRLDVAEMRRQAKADVERLGIETLQDITQSVETLSGGQRQAVAVARAVAFGSKVLIMDEPTAALGVREFGTGSASGQNAAGRRPASDLHQSQYAECVGPRGSDPDHAPRQTDCGRDPAEPHDGRGRGNDDGRQRGCP